MKPPRRPQSENVTGQRSKRESAVELLNLDGISRTHRRALWVVIGVTASMFLIETGAGHMFSSHALRADALDFLDDMLMYTLSLAVVDMGLRIRAAVATFKAGVLCIMSLWVLVSAIFHLPADQLPSAEVIAIVGLIGLATNALCQNILARFGEPAFYFRLGVASTRHDMVGSAAVVLTAVCVWAMDAAWPDLLVGIAAASHLLWLSVQTLRHAFALYRAS